jgi:hypothetical protein
MTRGFIIALAMMIVGAPFMTRSVTVFAEVAECCCCAEADHNAADSACECEGCEMAGSNSCACVVSSAPSGVAFLTVRDANLPCANRASKILPAEMSYEGRVDVPLLRPPIFS